MKLWPEWLCAAACLLCAVAAVAPAAATGSAGIWMRYDLQHQCTGPEQQSVASILETLSCAKRGPKGKNVGLSPNKWDYWFSKMATTKKKLC
jgi:hypothetical protein